MYTKVSLISTLAASLLATAAPAPRSTDSNIFEAVSLHSGSPIQASSINANGNHFYVGKPTSAYCPSGIQGLDCSNYSNQTAFAYSPSTSGLALSVGVPGGQLVYVEPNGALGFTTPHSNAIPSDSYTSPFQYTAQCSGGTVGKLTFEDKAFNACLVDGQEDVYQIFANAVAGQSQTDCIGIAIGTAEVSGPIAFEYS
ncbi:hypothetical protein EG329_013664 [Mollisiaceae sp. DMI_Dod_QoI]|nr:hypothetical protein EG329_013664 [Helotiales sp. DMI_Dod_QoI]